MLLTLVELQRKLMTQIREYSVLPDCDGGLRDAIDDTIDELMCLFSNEQAKAGTR